MPAQSLGFFQQAATLLNTFARVQLDDAKRQLDAANVWQSAQQAQLDQQSAKALVSAKAVAANNVTVIAYACGGVTRGTTPDGRWELRSPKGLLETGVKGQTPRIPPSKFNDAGQMICHVPLAPPTPAPPIKLPVVPVVPGLPIGPAQAAGGVPVLLLAAAGVIVFVWITR